MSQTLLVKQITAFSIVGVINTIVDFAVLNVLYLYAQMPLVISNILSTTVSLAVSYQLTKKWVFTQSNHSSKKQLLLYILVTLSGLYIIQTLVIVFFTNISQFPANQIAGLVTDLSGYEGGDITFFTVNTAKVLATFASAAWNFYFYRNHVFSKE